MASTHGTSPSLILGIKQNTPEAWERLIAIYTPLVTAWCTRSGLDPHSAQDVVQETFIAASQHIERMRSQVGSGSFRSWLWKITRNKLIDRSRRLTRSEIALGGSSAAERMANIPSAHEPSAVEPSTPDLINALVMRALDHVRAEFREESWKAFWRTAIDDAPSDIVANELGVTQAAVRQSRSRIMRRLRVELGDLE